jgi:hypothetical protein
MCKTLSGNLTGLNYLISEGHRVYKLGLGGGWKEDGGVGVGIAPLCVLYPVSREVV